MNLLKTLLRLIKSIQNPLLRLKNFNFQNSGQLADFQTKLLQDYIEGKLITDESIQKLERNAWVKAASEIAPGNLVIRQYCLIDILKNNLCHAKNIYRLLNRLSYGGQIWAEGYSYWIYTLDLLQPWVIKFNGVIIQDIIEMITQIHRGFLNTAYYRNGVLFPAPFGDVRDHPLVNQPLIKPVIDDCTVSIVTRVKLSNVDPKNSDVVYKIKGKPIGLNHHIQKDDSRTLILSGKPDFKFYEGIDKKYNSKEDELKDLFDIRRITSI